MTLLKKANALIVSSLLISANIIGSAQAQVLPDWSKAGYLEGANLPTSSSYTNNQNCRITPDELGADFGVYSNDTLDDSIGIQAAIDFIKANCSGSYNNLSLISLPAGELRIDRQIGVDASFLVIRGQGNSATSSSSTQIIFSPNDDTRYDGISDFNLSDMKGDGSAKGGWIWPGRGAFRVQSRAVHSSYASSHSSAPANRRDFYEGSVNFHWKNENITANAQVGDTEIQLNKVTGYSPGNYIWIGSANTNKFYDSQGVLSVNRINGHMRQQMFKIVSVNSSTKRVVLDKPLEFAIYTTNTADGSAAIKGSNYRSRAVNVDIVEGVGFENFHLTQVAPAGFSPEDAKNNYNNIDHEGAMHGLVFKWAANGFVKNVSVFMSGSHPIVTEMAKNMQFENNRLEGSWNKGKGGNGYFRNSKLWDSLIINNTLRDVRHLTLQWSASGNVVRNNNINADLNLHGGWERFNLIENNLVNVPYDHRDCSPNCTVGDETWYPIWYAPGEHAGRWSGASGPQNVFYNNTLKKQASAGGAFVDFGQYGSQPNTIFMFAWDTLSDGGSEWRHLRQGDSLIPFWTSRELFDYSSNNQGVNANCSASASSLVGASISCDGAITDEPDPVDPDPVDPDPVEPDPIDPPASCPSYTGGRQDLQLTSANCVTIPNGLAGRRVQIWNNKSGEGCGFKGSINGSEGGTFTISATYASGSGLTGDQLNFAGNSCTKVRVRVY